MVKRRVHLTFPEERVTEPIIYNLSKRFDIVTNIRRANVEETFGWVILEVEGTEESLEEGMRYLEQQGVQIDPIGDVLEG